MNILFGTVVFWAISAELLRRLHKRGQGPIVLASTRQLLVFTASRAVVALLGAGFVAELLPEDRIQSVFGSDAGFDGILLATALGPLTPGGAFVSFAVGAAALKAGAAAAPVLAYVSAWSLFSLTRMLAYELPLLGAPAIWARLAVSWPVPVFVAMAALSVF